MKRLAWLGVALIALTLLDLAPRHAVAGTTVAPQRMIQVFVGVMAVAGCVYLLAARTVLRQPPATRGAVWLVLGVALALRLSVLFAPPFLSSDVYRYVWDGTVQDAGINPYRYVPADPVLVPLRTAIYPHINRRTTTRTVYPPAAQVIFALVARVSPTVLAMKTTMVLFEFAAMAAMLAMLDLARLSRARLLIYAWNPLAVWSFAGNGHVDALAVGFVGLALLARARLRDGLAGALLGAAILVKFLPAAIAPALWRRRDWRLPVACVAVMAALYAIYLGAGWHVLGSLGGYANEEGVDRGTAFWLLAGIGQITAITPAMIAAYVVAAVIGLGTLALWVVLRTRNGNADIARVAAGAAVLGAATMAVLSPHYCWYFAWLALPCCLAPIPGVIYLSTASLLLLLNPFNERFFWAALLYGPAIALVARDARHRWPRPHAAHALERSA